jgi:hypothetical protein
MPRATRYLVDGYIYHLTHRCLDGEFFLRFVKERDAYREWLRVGACRYQVPMLGYALELNMVRAGRVNHPREWRWCSYRELMGKRQRYRIIDQPPLLWLTGFSSMGDFAGAHETRVEERLSLGGLVREPEWSEAIAVGDRDFVEAADHSISHRQAMEYIEVTKSGSEGTWAVRERPIAYNANSSAKNGL